jgi:omega-amidase
MSSLTLTTIQSSLHWEDKAANLAMFEKKILGITENTEIVVLPEMFSTGFSMQPAKFAESMDGPTVSWMKNLAAKKRIILTGSLIIEEGGKYFNRLIWMLPTGQYGVYDKRHLFAFAGEDKYYSAGKKRLIASVKGWKIMLQVCYDLRFPVWARQQIHPAGITRRVEEGENTSEYDLLIYAANWPERRSHAWKTLLAARAIENQCYVAGVNRVGNDGLENYHSGDTMVIDPMGVALYSKSHEEDVHTITLEKTALQEIRSKLPFLKDADPFTLLNDEKP